MTNSELRDAKESLLAGIRVCVQDKITDFEKETGLLITSVTIDVTKLQRMGAEAETRVTGVHAGVDL